MPRVQATHLCHSQLSDILLDGLWHLVRWDKDGKLKPFELELNGETVFVEILIGGDRPWINAVLGISCSLHANGCCCCEGAGRASRSSPVLPRTYRRGLLQAHYRVFMQKKTLPDGTVVLERAYGPTIKDFGGPDGYTCPNCNTTFKCQADIEAEVARCAAMSSKELLDFATAHKGQHLGKACLFPFHGIMPDVMHAVSAPSPWFSFPGFVRLFSGENDRPGSFT